jgi:hypothetical protein
MGTPIQQILPFVVFGILTGTAAARAEVAVPKIRVGIAPAQSRWVTLTDGTRVHQGLEIGYLLGHKLSESARYLPVLLSDQSPAPGQASSSQSMTLSSIDKDLLKTEAMKQVPQEWTKWAQSFDPSSNVGELRTMALARRPSARIEVRVQPQVETLLYASGNRSNRIVYGFSPGNENQFNEGRPGSIDNEFVSSPVQAQSCQKPDFFKGQFDTLGWGPFRSNFGANIDEGFMINIGGYGFGFKKKNFELRSQIRFLVDNLRTGFHKEYVFQTKAQGSDVFVAGSYMGYNLGIEIQRRETLANALKAILPQIIGDFINEGLPQRWQSTLLSAGGSLIMEGGYEDGVVEGLKVVSSFGNGYEVVQVFGATSLLKKISGSALPFPGEPLRLAGDGPGWEEGPTQTKSLLLQSLNGEKTYQADIDLKLDQKQRAASQTQVLENCFDKKTTWVEDTINALFSVYAYWRYKNVLDQEFSGPSKPAGPGLRVAVVGSGVDYKDQTIKSRVAVDGKGQLIGYDFLSQDPRPSDDNGQGTAAAKLLIQSVKAPVNIMPVKVIGAHGESHSSAVFEGFKFAADQGAEAIIAPWSSVPSTLNAYKMGAQYAAAKGVAVFLAPETMQSQTNIHIPAQISSKDFKTRGMSGSKVQLSASGVAVVEEFSRWMQSRHGGTHDSN